MYRNTLAVTKKRKGLPKISSQTTKKIDIWYKKKRNWIELSLPKKKKRFYLKQKRYKKKEINFKLHWPNHYWACSGKNIMNDIIVMNLAGDLCIIVSIFHKDMSEIHKKTIIGHVKCNPTWIRGNWRKENKERESYQYCGVSLG